jgi:5-methylcytosine-specific restriction endonuclease McrA
MSQRELSQNYQARYQRAWRRANPERARERDRKKEQRERERDPNGFRQKATARMRAWRARNPERAKEANKKHNSLRVKQWRANNKTKTRVYGSNYRARVSAAEGAYNAEDIQRLYKAQRGKCAYFRFCGNRLAGSYHIDHIIPLIEGGSNWPANLQLTCPECNQRKNRRDPLIFSRELGALL